MKRVITRKCRRCNTVRRIDPRFSQVQIICGCGQCLTRHDNTITMEEEKVDRKELFSFLKWLFGGLVLFVIVGWFLTGSGIMTKKFFGTMNENANREIFEETKSYNEGKTQQLAKYYQEYMGSNDIDAKAAIRGTIRTMFADYDADRLPPMLRKFLTDMRGY